jgi:cobalt-zinc-cadmium efflux system protein
MHTHSHDHDHSSIHLNQQQNKAFKKALWIAFFFMTIEIVGGWIANSLALISDALHLFTDVGALALGLLVVKITNWPSSPRMSYGYHRAEIIGALASSLSLWVLCAVLVYEAIKRLVVPEAVEGPIVFVIAGIGLIANFIMIRILHPSKGHSLNMRAAYLHVIGDLLGSAGVLIGGAVLWFTGWNPIDPIITILFSAAILFSSWKIIKQTTRVLMESAPEKIDPEAIERDLLQIPGVVEVHDLHVWSVSSKRLALSVHLVAAPSQQPLKAAHDLIEKKYQIHHTTIQIEDLAHFDPKHCADRNHN